MAWIRCTGNTGGSLKVRTASGRIATFETNMADVLQEVKCEINATGGNGTPDNPIPIVGYSSANITRCGVNLFDCDSKVSVTSAQVVYTSDDNYIYMNGTKNGGTYATFSSALYSLKKGTYYAKAFFISGTATNDPQLSFILPDGSATGNIVNGATFTLSEDSTIYPRFAIWTDNTVFSNLKIGIVISTASISEYAPYNGNTVTISFGQTVYGGVLDVTRGKLTVTSAYLALNGSENWTDYAAYNGFWLVMSDMKSGSFMDGKANYLQTLAAHGHGIRFGANNNLIYCEEIITDMAEVSDLATWKTYLSTHNLEIVYPLATPFDIELTPVQIEQLLGKNNVWHDANGDTEVKYLEVVRN